MESHSPTAREAELRRTFGELLTLRDVAVLLRFPSIHAARKARSRGRFPVDLVQLPNRRGWYATVGAVARLLDELDNRGRRAQAEDLEE